jgi:ABC-type transport system involved in multi-copper enzyme maturation permease subunit
MTEQQVVRPGFSIARVSAIAATRVRRVVRTRIAFAATVFALLPWAAVETHALVERLAALAEFSVVGLTALAAGAISDDLDSGEFAIAVSHDVSPIEMLVGNAVASLALVSALVAAQLPLALAGTDVPAIAALLLCFAPLVALLGAWLALMLLLATFLEGKANAVAMIVVLFVPLVLDLGLLARLPRGIASPTEYALRLLPRVDQATTLFGALLDRSPIQMLDLTVLIISPFLYFALASYRLHRLEPAGRLTQ